MARTKTRLLSLVLAVVMAIGILATGLIRFPNGLSAAQTTFTDVPTTFWAYDYIERAAADGVVNGIGNNRFNPYGTLTVAHWMVIVTRAFCSDRVNASSATGTWYAKNKDVADQLGLLKGVSNTNMNSAINRYDMAQIAHNVLYAAGCEVMGIVDNYGVHLVKDRIGDWNKIPQKYQIAVGTVFDNGIIMGTDDKGTFNGSGTFTRAQAAAVYSRMASFMEWDAGMMFPSKLELDASEGELAEPEDTEEVVTAPVENVSSEQTLKNGKAVTEENVLEIIEELKVKYPDGSKYDPNTSYYSKGFQSGSRECAKLAFMLSDEIFGDLPARTHTDVSKIRPGDVIRTTYHWSIATARADAAAAAEKYPGISNNAYMIGSVDGGSAGYIDWTDVGCSLIYQEDDVIIYTRYLD